MVMDQVEIFPVAETALSTRNINNMSARIFQILEPGRFEKRVIAIKNPEAIERNKAEGGDGTFTKLQYVLKVQQIAPDRGAGQERTLYFEPNRSEQEALEQGHQPVMRASSPLGRLTKDFEDLGFGSPLSEDAQGKVVVVAQYTEPVSRGSENTRTRYNFVACIGDRKDYDLDEGMEIMTRINSGSKRV